MKKKNTHKPIKVGLTGGIGSGKTTVSNILKTVGIPVFNSDDESKNLLKVNPKIINDVKNLFGKSIIQEEEDIDLKKLGNIVFSNKSKLNQLSNILHPEVLIKFKQWMLTQNTTYIIKESAILFETKTYKELDKIIIVTAPLALRIDRIKKRDHRDIKQIKSIINNQLNLNTQLDKADYIINNDEKSLLIPKVIDLHMRLSRL
ncbi:MAG: dephospho-CoA kinase [Flavobacteriales bacterium]|nr:dephospho-CoA kinase [Flavobacteriales bacterium]